jgi:hypothetical protein
MARGYLVPAIVVVAVVAVFLGVGTLAGWFSSAAPEGATEPSESSDGAAVASDVSTDARETSDASAVASTGEDASPKSRTMIPAHRPARPGRPPMKRPKH